MADATDTQVSGVAARLKHLLSGDDDRKFYTIVTVGTLLSIVMLFTTKAYLTKTIYVVFMYMGLAYAWNYLSGYTGYVTFGPFAFIGIGAYGTAVLVKYVGLPWFVALAGAALFTALVAVVLGFILLRISGIYFAIATLLVGEGLRQGVLMETEYLRGSIGLNVPPISTETAYLMFLALAVVGLVLTYESATSRFGLRMLAVRDDEQALLTMGVNPLKYKMSSFVIHAVLTALIGGVYGLSLGFLFPSTVFSITMTITLILIVILGGIGTVWGPAIGAIILLPMQEVLWLEFPNLHVLIYGLALIGLIIFMPEGILSKLKELDWLPRSRSI